MDTHLFPAHLMSDLEKQNPHRPDGLIGFHPVSHRAEGEKLVELCLCSCLHGLEQNKVSTAHHLTPSIFLSSLIPSINHFCGLGFASNIPPPPMSCMSCIPFIRYTNDDKSLITRREKRHDYMTKLLSHLTTTSCHSTLDGLSHSVYDLPHTS